MELLRLCSLDIIVIIVLVRDCPIHLISMILVVTRWQAVLFIKFKRLMPYLFILVINQFKTINVFSENCSCLV